jgi:hypothetical protein
MGRAKDRDILDLAENRDILYPVLRVTYRKTPFRAWHIELQHYPQQIGT